MMGHSIKMQNIYLLDFTVSPLLTALVSASWYMTILSCKSFILASSSNEDSGTVDSSDDSSP